MRKSNNQEGLEVKIWLQASEQSKLVKLRAHDRIFGEPSTMLG